MESTGPLPKSRFVLQPLLSSGQASGWVSTPVHLGRTGLLERRSSGIPAIAVAGAIGVAGWPRSWACRHSRLRVAGRAGCAVTAQEAAKRELLQPCQADCINILVVGECGDGKSTLINRLRDPNQSLEPLCGRNPEGVTKEVVLYRCPDLGGKPFNLIDTPGIGDSSVTPVALIALLEEFLGAGMVPGGIRGVIVTTPISDCRIKLGAQVVQTIVEKGFVAAEGQDKYANIIFTGTKADKADEEDKATFMHGTNGNKSVRELFFKHAESPGKGPAVMVHKEDYSPLLKAIQQLPNVSILYRAPEAKVMSAALAEKIGIEQASFEQELLGMRETVRQQSDQIRELTQQRHEAYEQHREDMKQREKQMEDLRRHMEKDRRGAEEQRERREREQEKLRKEEQETARQARQQEMERLEAQARQQQAAQEKMLLDAQRQAAEERMRHEEQMQRMQEESERRFQLALQASRRGGGGGCFPGSATVETPHGPKPMTALRAGDQVLAVGATGELFFDEVYFFGHAQATERAPYTWLRLASGKVLRATPRHMVPVKSPVGQGKTREGTASWRCAEYRYAGCVHVGDEVWVCSASGSLSVEAVLEVASGWGQGLFNPFTFSGTLVVDGVVASVHSEWLLDDLVPMSWVPRLHSIYQALLLPGRCLYRLLGPQAADLLEVNNPQGKWHPTIETSPRAFAFFLAAHLVPAGTVTASLARYLVFS